MRYYTYRLTLKPDPRYYYFGVHRTEKEPEFDGYFGSGNAVRELKNLYGKDCFEKQVLSEFSSRQESLLEEERLVGDLWKKDPFCLNRMPGGAFRQTFDSTGLITYHRGSTIKHIHPCAVERFESAGWKRGLPPARAEQIRRYILVHKGDVERRIDPDDLETFRAEGWSRGRSPKTLELIRSKVHITDGNTDRYVPLKHVQTFLDKGWKKGHTATHTQKSVTWNKGSVYVFRGKEQTKVRPEDLERYLAEGWQRGNLNTRRPKSEADKERSRETQRGRIWVNDGKRCEKVWPEVFEVLQKQGWVKGRLKGQVPNTQGYFWVHNEKECRTVPREDLEKYLEQGWQRGKVKGLKSLQYRFTPLYRDDQS